MERWKRIWKKKIIKWKRTIGTLHGIICSTDLTKNINKYISGCKRKLTMNNRDIWPMIKKFKDKM